MNTIDLDNLTVDQAIQIAKKECKNISAQAYLSAIPESIDYGEEGLKTQLLYALYNMRCWRGQTARNVKKVLSKYANGRLQ